MKTINPESTKTTISLAPDLKRAAIKIAKTRWGKSGNLSILISELIRKEYSAENGTCLSERESVADSLQRASRKKTEVKESSRKASRKLGA